MVLLIEVQKGVWNYVGILFIALECLAKCPEIWHFSVNWNGPSIISTEKLSKENIEANIIKIPPVMGSINKKIKWISLTMGDPNYKYLGYIYMTSNVKILTSDLKHGKS